MRLRKEVKRKLALLLVRVYLFKAGVAKGVIEQLHGVHDSQGVEWRSVREREANLDKLLEMFSHRYEMWKNVTENIGFSLLLQMIAKFN